MMYYKDVINRNFETIKFSNTVINEISDDDKK